MGSGTREGGGKAGKVKGTIKRIEREIGNGAFADVKGTEIKGTGRREVVKRQRMCQRIPYNIMETLCSTHMC